MSLRCRVVTVSTLCRVAIFDFWRLYSNCVVAASTCCAATCVPCITIKTDFKHYIGSRWPGVSVEWLYLSAIREDEQTQFLKPSPSPSPNTNPTNHNPNYSHGQQANAADAVFKVAATVNKG